eukprot:scaffold1480_cov123-Isochrysis_galbana.AAC.6
MLMLSQCALAQRQIADNQIADRAQPAQGNMARASARACAHVRARSARILRTRAQAGTWRHQRQSRARVRGARSSCSAGARPRAVGHAPCLLRYCAGGATLLLLLPLPRKKHNASPEA